MPRVLNSPLIRQQTPHLAWFPSHSVHTNLANYANSPSCKSLPSVSNSSNASNGPEIQAVRYSYSGHRPTMVRCSMVVENSFGQVQVQTPASPLTAAVLSQIIIYQPYWFIPYDSVSTQRLIQRRTTNILLRLVRQYCITENIQRRKTVTIGHLLPCFPFSCSASLHSPVFTRLYLYFHVVFKL